MFVAYFKGSGVLCFLWGPKLSYIFPVKYKYSYCDVMTTRVKQFGVFWKIGGFPAVPTFCLPGANVWDNLDVLKTTPSIQNLKNSKLNISHCILYEVFQSFSFMDLKITKNKDFNISLTLIFPFKRRISHVFPTVISVRIAYSLEHLYFNSDHLPVFKQVILFDCSLSAV